LREALLCALAITGLSVTAHAADLDLGSVKDALPDKLSWSGVTLYGTIDLGYAYQNHGVPMGGSFPQTLEYNIWSSKNANKEISSLAASALQRSSIGLQVEERIGADWRAIGRIDTTFNPLSGELSDGPASLLRNFGVPLADQRANGDSNRAGQTINGTAYAGVSNVAYGMITAGRQETLQDEVLRAYDPQRLSYAFSLLGWSSSFAAAGDGEAARWNNSVKYAYSYGAVHAAVHYTNGGADTGIFGGAYGFDLGGSYRGVSLDAVYQKEMSVVSAAAASSTTLKATISDNQSWSV
jgi:predicted porin